MVKKIFVILLIMILFSYPAFSFTSTYYVVVGSVITSSILNSDSNIKKKKCKLLQKCLDFKGGNACMLKFKQFNCNIVKGD